MCLDYRLSLVVLAQFCCARYCTKRQYLLGYYVAALVFSCDLTSIGIVCIFKIYMSTEYRESPQINNFDFNKFDVHKRAD